MVLEAYVDACLKNIAHVIILFVLVLLQLQ